MDNLLKHKDYIFELKQNISNKDPSLFLHTVLNKTNYLLDNNTVSIVMSASNRSKQTYFTLSTIEKSSYKNIQVIIVDDSDVDPLKIDVLCNYPFYIDLIQIKRENKKWHNPLISYNIGFQFVEGSRVIIQNAEVCHVGDNISFVNTNLEDNIYYVFDVKASLNFLTNEGIYKSDLSSVEIFNSYEFFGIWYQGYENLRNYHFLTAMTRTTFDIINGFSYDYTMGSCFDDDDFVLKIISKNISFKNLFHTNYNLGGIHLYHKIATDSWDRNVASNMTLFLTKKKIYEEKGIYYDITENKEDFKNKYNVINSKNKVVVTITGIRPDFIRMSSIFKELDDNFKHILIHTGQHYDEMLSNTFFKELSIREPDYLLNAGADSNNHFDQLSYLCIAIPKIFEEYNIKPDLIIFLGDSNSVGISFSLKKAGYKIAHIEAGMRSYDRRMLEEINRTVCDHCSDLLFVYHDDYKKNLELENIKQNVFVVGNTIVEPFNKIKDNIICEEKKRNVILIDIHRPENFNSLERLQSIIHFANMCNLKYNIPVKLIYFKRLQEIINKNSLRLGNIEIVPLMSYKDYLTTVYNCLFIISDSGTGQEEPALLNTPVIVPRDYTERPQSYANNCSKQLSISARNDDEIFEWIEGIQSGCIKMNISWLGDGNVSKEIVKEIVNFL